jgi:drug/metabolite transporter superfamily protein YnfA
MSATTISITSVGFFLLAALAEIGGGYLVWLWKRQKKRIIYAVVGGLILFTYGIIPTLQPPILEECMLHMVGFLLFVQSCGERS